MARKYPAEDAEGTGKLFRNGYAAPWVGVVIKTMRGSGSWRGKNEKWVSVYVVPLFDRRGKPIERRYVKHLHPAWLGDTGETIDLSTINPAWLKPP